jgi:hypothetical protein
MKIVYTRARLNEIAFGGSAAEPQRTTEPCGMLAR